MKIIILRDPRESPRKCSLIPLRGRPDVEFIPFDRRKNYDFGAVTLLDPDGPPLSLDDRARPLLVLDSSWRHLPELRKTVKGEIFPRSIPAGFVTAYPRKSKVYPDPSVGLASVEALFVTTLVLGESDPSLLDHYYWKSDFLRLNEKALKRFV